VPIGTFKAILRAAGSEDKAGRRQLGGLGAGLTWLLTTGRTLEETKANIRVAIQRHIQTLGEFGDPVPSPSPR